VAAVESRMGKSMPTPYERWPISVSSKKHLFSYGHSATGGPFSLHAGDAPSGLPTRQMIWQVFHVFASRWKSSRFVGLQ
jgi:hypothetical protein